MKTFAALAFVFLAGAVVFLGAHSLFEFALHHLVRPL